MNKVPAIAVIRITVRGKKTSTWYLSWRDPLTGKLMRQATGARQKSVAQIMAHEKAREFAFPAPVDPTLEHKELKWKIYVHEYLANYARTKEPATARAYETKLQVFTEAMRPNLLREVDRKLIQQFVANQLTTGKSPHTIDGYLRHLRTALNVAESWHYIPQAPVFKGLFVGRDEGERRVILPEDIRGIVAALDQPELALEYRDAHWWRAFLRTLHFTGMRLGEMLGLRWDAVDFGKRFIKVAATTSKSRKTRTLPNCDELLTTLADWKKQQTPLDVLVFPLPLHRQTGKPKAARVIYYDFAMIQTAAGIEPGSQYDFQDYRSTCATEMLEANTPTVVVKDWLGHAKNSTVLERYYANTLRALANVGVRRQVV